LLANGSAHFCFISIPQDRWHDRAGPDIDLRQWVAPQSSVWHMSEVVERRMPRFRTSLGESALDAKLLSTVFIIAASVDAISAGDKSEFSEERSEIFFATMTGQPAGRTSRRANQSAVRGRSPGMNQRRDFDCAPRLRPRHTRATRSSHTSVSLLQVRADGLRSSDR
jgi:hypothetical protein